jgi:hypothetical protein
MAIFLASAAANTLAFLGFGAFLAMCVMGILYFLFPCIVMLQLWALNEKGTKQLSELQRQNILTRQLLRAYGHEPEA